MLYLAISLLYCANPTLFFSCRNNTAAVLFSAMHNHCITFNTLPQRYFTTHYRCEAFQRDTGPLLFNATLLRGFSQHSFAIASPVITMPFPCSTLPCQHTTPQHHDGASQLTTAPTLWRASPQRDGSMQCRNKATTHFAFASQEITKLCDSISRQDSTKPVLHCVQPYQYRTPCCATLRCRYDTEPYHYFAPLRSATPRRYLAVHYFALPLPRPALPNTTIASTILVLSALFLCVTACLECHSNTYITQCSYYIANLPIIGILLV